MPKINYVRYNNTRSDTLGIYVSGSGSYDVAEMDVTSYAIPGRNGDLLIPNNRYKNIEITYPAFVPGDFSAQAQSIRNWLRSRNTYGRLVDSYDPTHFRLAINSARQSFSPVNRNDGANFEIIFNCKPQRFVLIGGYMNAVTSGDNMANSTVNNAFPLFEIDSTNTTPTFKVVNSLGNFELTATESLNDTFYVDCETQNIYTGSINLNNKFVGDFPIFAPGSNVITYSGCTTFYVQPNWWEL